MLDLERDRAAVRALERWQHIGQRLAGDIDTKQVRGDARHELRREPVSDRIHGGIADRWCAQRIEMRTEMTMRAVRLDQRRGRLHRGEHRAVGLRRRRDHGCFQRREDGVCRRTFAQRGRRRQAEAREHVLVEPVGTGEQCFDASQELSRLCALDDAMVVRAGHRHDLSHAEVAKPRF